MNNYQKATVKEILKSVKILCKECGGKMVKIMESTYSVEQSRMLYDDTLIGYRCKNCPHYNLLDDNPV